MKSFTTLLAFVVVVLATPARSACEDPFVWQEGSDRLELSLRTGQGFLRIGASAEQRMRDDPEWSAGLYSHFSTDAERLFQPIFWSSGASVSLGAPDVSGSGPAGENRVRFGDRRPLRDREIGWEHFGGFSTSHSEPWTWSRNLGEAPLERFREAGSVRIEHWSGESRGRLERRTWARYDWDRVERLIQSARDHFANCAPAG